MTSAITILSQQGLLLPVQRLRLQSTITGMLRTIPTGTLVTPVLEKKPPILTHTHTHTHTHMALLDKDLQKAANDLGCELATIKAVVSVESSGKGFNPDGSICLLFEGHHFSKYTKGIYNVSHPTISYPKWTKVYYGKTYKLENIRFNTALSLNREAAIKSTSFGAFQILGSNHKQCGITTLEEFFSKMKESEQAQLDLFVAFIKTSNLVDALKNKDWATFARRYNGPGQVDFYANKLAVAYSKYK